MEHSPCSPFPADGSRSSHSAHARSAEKDFLAAAAFALLFAGPGRVSLDRPTPWYRHPVATGWTFLLIAG